MLFLLELFRPEQYIVTKVVAKQTRFTVLYVPDGPLY